MYYSSKGQYSDAMELQEKNLYCSVIESEFYCKAPFLKYESVGDAIFCQCVFPLGGYVSENVSMVDNIYFFFYNIKYVFFHFLIPNRKFHS
jgi:hypothetical protein